MPTKLYKNTGKEALSIPGIGDLEPGEQVSLTGEYLPPVIVENYPGLADITDAVVEEEASASALAEQQTPKEEAPSEASQSN